MVNIGGEFLRLDAVAFIWKREGTNCENHPEAHQIIQACHSLARIVAPALLFKSEAIVHPDDMLRYISLRECQISYNPLRMALPWESLATGEVKLLDHSLPHRVRLPAGTSWVNYLRLHDDSGWTFDDNDARWEWIDPIGHRIFLKQFPMGCFPGSIARGVPFQENPETGDARISGTLAWLAGLEEAMQSANELQVELARVNEVRLSTVRRWVRWYRDEGVRGLARLPREDRGKRRDMPEEMIQVIEGLALSKPGWEPAIERLLRGCGLRLLVADEPYPKVSCYIDKTHLGGRLVSLHVRGPRTPRHHERLSADFLYHKLEVKPDTAFTSWLNTELLDAQNYRCCETLEEFQRCHLAVTINGQIKRGQVQHEKDDRSELGNRRRYVLGWNNLAVSRRHCSSKKKISVRVFDISTDH